MRIPIDISFVYEKENIDKDNKREKIIRKIPFQLNNEGLLYATVSRHSLIHPILLMNLDNIEYYYTEGKEDFWSLAICKEEECRILYNEGLYKWTRDISNINSDIGSNIIDIVPILILTDMIFEGKLDPLDETKEEEFKKIFKSIIKGNERFINTVSKNLYEGMFMQDWFSEGHSYMYAYMSCLICFLYSAEKKEGAWRDSVICGVIEAIFNEDIEKYENEFEFYFNIGNEYKKQFIKSKARRESDIEFGKRIREKKNTLIRKRRGFFVNRKKIDPNQRYISDKDMWDN